MSAISIKLCGRRLRAALCLSVLASSVGILDVGVATCAAAPIGAPPNIIFIFSDDHAAQAMSCYGSRINRTPNLDRIAAGGMLFRNCFCTNSICGPAAPLC